VTITYPYTLPFFADLLKIDSVIWDIQRNDESSGTGDGRIWTAELAPPLWLATVNLSQIDADSAKQIAAKIRKLQGSRQQFFLYDPLSMYPQSDKDGSMLTGRTVLLNSIATDRGTIGFSGLPSGYVLTVGDKFSYAYSSGPTRYGFHEISETVVASGAGTTPSFGVFPNLPAGVATGAVITLIKPACKCILYPGSHNPGTTGKDHTTSGASFKAIQKK
jgi:hypothetical protein